MRGLFTVDAGVVPYDVADSWQRELHRMRLDDEIPDVLLTLEHPHVYTLGRNFRPEHLSVSPQALRDRGIDVFEADRGGSITYHGPGQLVAYPIVDLRRGGDEQPDVMVYLRTLEEAIVRTVRSLGVAAGRRDGLTGVWVGASKLASIGVNVSGGVSRHGLALNVNTDLSYFDGMVPCGIRDVEVTSLKKILARDLEVAPIIETLASSLAAVMHRRVVWGAIGDLVSEDGGMGEGARVIPLRKDAV